jgi:hypothetical protein
MQCNVVLLVVVLNWYCIITVWCNEEYESQIVDFLLYILLLINVYGLLIQLRKYETLRVASSCKGVVLCARTRLLCS